jgi:tetratricopeptide (TPR) repeat protein
MDSDTLALFLRACDGIHDFQREDETRDALQQVVRRQPRFAKAIGMMAIADSIAAETLPPGQDATASRQAKAEAERALQLDASQPDAFVALANLNDDTAAGRARAVATLRRGISAAPDSPELNNWLGGLLLKTGYVDAALRYGQRAADLDPFTPLKPNLVIRTLAAGGRLEEARKVMDQTAARWPDTPDVMLGRITLEMEVGDAGRTAALLADPDNRPPIWTPAMAGVVHDALVVRAHGGDIRPAAAQVLALLRTRKAGANFVTRLLLALGDVDDAFAVAGAGPAGSIDTTLLFEPVADPMRHDPRFPSLARRLGLVAFWRAEHRWPDFCAEPGLPYDCRKL